MPRMPASRKQNSIWLSSGAGYVNIANAAAKFVCHIYVPFKHRLLSAYMTYRTVAETGAITIQLAYAADGTASGSETTLGSAATSLASGTTTEVVTVALTEAQKNAEIAAGKVYGIYMTGTHSADAITGAGLTIQIQPQPRVCL